MEYAWLIPAFPLAGFLINGLLGSRLRKGFIGCVACAAVAFSFLVAVLLFFELLAQPVELRAIEYNYFTWIKVGELEIPFGILIDPLSIVMVLVVTGVGFLIHVYSIGYMHDDPGYFRYFAYLNLFVAAMLTLVLSNNLLAMFVGWEGVGLCSYLLIGFWYEKKSASDAGKKAFIVNRVGDFGFLIAIFLTFWTFRSLNFGTIFDYAAAHFHVGEPVITGITLLLFLGAVGKSAQIPLYIWLPDAMEGPTPVSALIHAATMVTAGVYMVARCSVLYALAPFSLGIVAVIGCATAFYAATIGIAQNDIKRILAYSTISQLGYMFLGCGVGAFAAGIFHLMTHAFFKALLFLGAGSVMHALGGELDIRNMGGLRKRLPLTYWTFMSATLAICGIVPFSGFFSKDEILGEAFNNGHYILYLIGLSGAALTAFYMFRLVFVAFHGESRVDPERAKHIHDAPPSMATALVSLAILALIGGWVEVPFIEGGKRFDSFLEPVFSKAHHLAGMGGGELQAHFWLEGVLMGLSLVVAIGGIAIAYWFYVRDPSRPAALAKRFAGLYQLILNKYYVDEIYQAIVVNPLRSLAEGLWQGVDVRFIDGAVNGVAQIATAAGGSLRRLQTGVIQQYALSILVGACALFIYMLSR